MSYKIADVKFNNGRGTVLCNVCCTMLVDSCDTRHQIDCAHLCEKCWDVISQAMSADPRHTAHIAMRLQKLENFVHFVANDYYELSYEKVKWQRDDFMKQAKKVLQELDNEDLL